MNNATAEPIQLKNAGDKHTMDVASCGELPFGKYKEYEFVGCDGSVVRVPKASTERQLGRLSLTPESVVGRRVTLKRDASNDPAKPFWGIYLEEGGAEGGTGRPATAGAAAVGRQPARETGTAATPQPAPAEKSSAIYKRMTQYVLSDIMPLYEANQVPFDGATVAAIVATLFINSKNGH